MTKIATDEMVKIAKSSKLKTELLYDGQAAKVDNVDAFEAEFTVKVVADSEAQVVEKLKIYFKTIFSTAVEVCDADRLWYRSVNLLNNATKKNEWSVSFSLIFGFKEILNPKDIPNKQRATAKILLDLPEINL